MVDFRTTTFVMACKNGHKIELPSKEAEARNMTPCPICQKPLMLKEFRTRTGRGGDDG